MQLDLIKLIASVKPFVAAAKVSERIDTVIKSLVTSSSPTQIRNFAYLFSFLGTTFMRAVREAQCCLSSLSRANYNGVNPNS